MCLLLGKCSQHIDEFYVQAQSQLAPMQRVPFSILPPSLQTVLLTLCLRFMYKSRCVGSVELNGEQQYKLLSVKVYQSLA